jgi:hypothetical protein
MQEIKKITGPIASVTDGGITIGFSEFYEKDINEFNFFSMSRKRNFASMAERCADVLTTLLVDEDFALKLLELRYQLTAPVDSEDFITCELLTEKILNLFSDNVVNIISTIVEDIYIQEEVNINAVHISKNNEELQFTNEHALIILKWSYACVAVAPIITVYMDQEKIQSRDSMTLIIGVFNSILTKFLPDDGSVDILAKIKKLVESRVLQTRYSDKVIWNYLRNLAVDPYIFIEKLYRKFISEGIPKLDQGTNIIKFFHTFLKNQIRFQFTAKFSTSYKPIRANITNSEGVSAMEHLESELIRKDEASAVLNEIICLQSIKSVAKDINWKPNIDELNYWIDLIRENGINAWQKGIITKFFIPKIGKSEFIRTRSLVDYTYMFLITRQWLIINDFPILAAYMSARISEGSVDARKLMARKKFIKEFMDSTAYIELLDTFYSTTSQSIIDSNIIIDMISAVHVGNFVKFTEYGEEEPEVPELISVKVESLAQETLRFISHII